MSLASVVDALIGPVPAGWALLTLGEACALGGGDVQTGPFGSQLHASDYVSTGVPSIMPVNIGDNRLVEEGIARVREVDAERLTRHRVRTGDIVYSRRGDVERRALIRDREAGWLCGTGCLRIRFGDGHIDPTYASYYLGHPNVRAWIVRHAQGATMPNLNTSILSALPFVVPPIATQRRIGDILGTLDDKIELNRRLAETLEGTARALFRSWFVDFDSPQVSGADDWANGALEDLADLNPEVWPSRDRPSVLRYVDLSGTKWGRIGAVTDYPADEAPSRAQRILRPGDTIVGTVRPGNGSYALVTQDGLTGSTGFAQLRPKTPRDAAFVYLAATARANIDALAHLADGGAYPAVRPGLVTATPVVVPDNRTLQVFSVAASPFLERAALAIDESETLGTMRDALLPRLLSGDFEVAA